MSTLIRALTQGAKHLFPGYHRDMVVIVVVTMIMAMAKRTFMNLYGFLRLRALALWHHTRQPWHSAGCTIVRCTASPAGPVRPRKPEVGWIQIPTRYGRRK